MRRLQARLQSLPVTEQAKGTSVREAAPVPVRRAAAKATGAARQRPIPLAMAIGALIVAYLAELPRGVLFRCRAPGYAGGARTSLCRRPGAGHCPLSEPLWEG